VSGNESFVAASAKWFPEIPDFPEFEHWLSGDDKLCVLVKHNSKRRVYALLPAAGHAASYYLKHDHPKETWDILRSWIYPKVLREFSTLKLLRKYKVAAVIPVTCGWRHGQGVLITKALTGSVTADKLWPEVCEGGVRKKRLLDGLRILIQCMINAGVRHSDFHFGNILAVEGANDTYCALVDVHGVSVNRNLSQGDKMSLIRLLAGWALDLEQDEVQRFLQPFFPDASIQKLDTIWQSFRLLLARPNRHKWWGRRRKLLNANGKSNSFCSIIYDYEGIWRWRAGFDLTLLRETVQRHQQAVSRRPELLIRESNETLVSRVETGGLHFIVKEFLFSGLKERSSAACQSWLCNWQLEKAGMPVAKYLAWLHSVDGKGYLVIEDLQGVLLDVALINTANDEAGRKVLLDKLCNLISHLYTWGIYCKVLDAQHIIVRMEQGMPRLYLVDNNVVFFYQRIGETQWERTLSNFLKTLPDLPGLKDEFALAYAKAKACWQCAISG